MHNLSPLLTLPSDLTTLILGQGEETFQLRSLEDNRQATLVLAQQATRSVQILTNNFEPTIYDQLDFIESMGHLARRSQHSKIQVLLQHPEQMVKQGHRFIELSRRLTSNIEIRQPHVQDRENPAAFLLVDERGLLYRKYYTRPEGTLQCNASIEGRNLRDAFQLMWSMATPDPELRSLHI